MKSIRLQIVSMILLAVAIAPAAGACRWTAVVAHSSMGGCHASGMRSRPHGDSNRGNPQPADYKCCARQQAPALVMSVFWLQPGVVFFVAESDEVSVLAGEIFSVLPDAPPPGSPPGISILRV
jgi:hypothetical protein